MKCSYTCESCVNSFELDFDETIALPSYCPFCSEEITTDGMEYLDDLPDSDWLDEELNEEF